MTQMTTRRNDEVAAAMSIAEGWATDADDTLEGLKDVSFTSSERIAYANACALTSLAHEITSISHSLQHIINVFEAK